MTPPADAVERRLTRRIGRPSSHWLLLALMATALTMALTAQGYARRQIGRSSTAARPSPPVSGLEAAGPVIDFSSGRARSVRSPAGTIALTFDDGPSPRWTPRILAVLRAHHVPATFFVVGSQVVAHPGLVRRELADGHELGSHTFTHADLGSLPGWRANLELSLTQVALAGATGRHTALFRLPYSSTVDALTTDQLRGERDAARQGYLDVLADRDSEDWRRPGVATIVARALPDGTDGAVIMLHDGGGDRSQTVAALQRLIPMLQARGDRFTTVSGLAGLAPGSATGQVDRLEHVQGMGLLWTMQAAFVMTGGFTLLTILVAALVVWRMVVLVLFARRHSRIAAEPDDDDGYTPPVSIVVPAFNEEVGIAAAVRSLATGDYPTIEVIVVDDGSTDATAAVVAGLGLANVTLVRQANAGKPAALNAGLARASHDIVVTVDGDTVFEPATLTELVKPFRDPRVGAVSGNTKVGNRGRLLGRWQHIEYVMGFNLDRRLFDLLDCMPTVPGAIGAFRGQALAAVGGVSDDTLAEDTDLTMAINRAGWRIVYAERARAWTEAPASLTALWRQRYRWCYGTLQSIWKHRSALWARGEPGKLGREGLPYLLLFQVLLPMLAPVFDLFAVYGLVFLDPVLIGAIWLGFNVLQLALAVYAFRLDREPLRPLWALPLQQFVYRQLMYLVVIQSVTSALLGTRLRWHKLHRTGDIEVLAARG
jgi:cellulose synthase/poly-beta-1,6-N-acetylglucosamine synthase-like glycosyltransferase/peptidoglycan/xylan/chitin deacetylase (PgdA/CDA1 family)